MQVVDEGARQPLPGFQPRLGGQAAQPVQGLVLAELLKATIAIRLGPAQPRGMAWKGAGGWLIFSQSRQVNFSRTAWITFH